MMKNWSFLGWYYQQGGEQVGPVTGEEIARLVGTRQLRLTEEVLQGWKDANNRVRYFGCHAADARRGTVTGGGANDPRIVGQPEG